ncbi:ATP-dependent sacrificial sulfur transferase LarE [Aeoliella sp. ICT_H6.2]|uniref:ATP-dependent sacrificial sulfur transferase LarE n=1 Tax=Aeoliella straminimaris TaxID=2954799 RepID=A0A9X2FC02_9BACT|nr:ATP-dependent sacrificial sulfur transferase LarE [Aeoliella straminimaris]MCO6043549.1 ATP-dependent sacrificial sulfur transferase LarE [Aeoliella straminimaris]
MILHKTSIAVVSLADQLVANIRSYGSCVVAYSGGVDSAVVSKAAHLALGERAVAVTGIGPAVPKREVDIARRVAKSIGIQHVEIATAEMENSEYVSNSPNRCFHCKQELYGVLRGYAEAHGIAAIANGTITEDLSDYRPGLAAADKAGVRAPLVECKLDKDAVRSLARYWDLEVWDKPPSPCLASRVAYGQEVTPERLRMIDQAEQRLHSLGICECRVRFHDGDLARIEVPLEAIETLAEPAIRAWLHEEFQHLGFRYITIDLAGFRSGSLNAGLPVVQ